MGCAVSIDQGDLLDAGPGAGRRREKDRRASTKLLRDNDFERRGRGHGSSSPTWVGEVLLALSGQDSGTRPSLPTVAHQMICPMKNWPDGDGAASQAGNPTGGVYAKAVAPKLSVNSELS